MNKPLAPDYEALSPDCVLNALEAAGFEPDGRLMALNSFENRVYQIGLEDDGFVVAKFYRPNRWSDAAIEEEHAFTLALEEAEIPVTPPLSSGNETLHRHRGYRFAVFPRQGGREPVLESAENLAWLGRTLGRLHGVGRAIHFENRLQLMDAERVADAASHVVDAQFVPPHLEAEYRSISSVLVGLIHDRFAETHWPRQSIHGDCHRGNVLWTESGPHLVDFDDCCSGPPVADFWMLLDGDPEERSRQIEILLEGYEQFSEFDRSQLVLIEALRAARMIEYAAWIARRWDDPTFPASFPWFGQPRYWEEHLSNLADQVNRMKVSSSGYGFVH
ncbi:MAG: serine/threonine protein kinase [Xanthomonadales bacterium]|nr:serine/threonine protein kinase [Xanthomonadales bacterium]